MPSLDTRTARFAGIAYLIIILTGLSAEFLIRAPMTAAPVGTLASDVAASLRLSAAADTVMLTADVILAILLFFLLRRAGQGLALAAMVFRLVQAAIIAFGLAALIAAAETSAALPGVLDRHAVTYDVGLFFFGINSLLTGVLLGRVGARLLGAGIALAGIVYIIGSTLRVAAPDLLAMFEPAYLIAVVAELSFCIWLLLGARFRAGVRA